MKLAPALLAILLAACAYAQTDQPDATPPSNAPGSDQNAPYGANQTQTEPSPPQSSTDATAPEASTTIRGCLEAGSDHEYTVVDKNGTRYALISTDVNALNALNSHVGEEVEADGELTSGSDASGAGPATEKPAATPSQIFKISDVRKVSDKCTM